MSNYNHARYLPESIGAILAQSYRPSEIIIIDDASTDNSVEIIHAFIQKAPTIQLICNERNLGSAHNAKRLQELASGQYIFFASADDWVLPGLFEKSMRLLSQFPQAGLCSAMSKVVDAASGRQINLSPLGNIASRERYIPPGEALRRLRHKGSWFTGNTCVYRRDALLEAGGLMHELHAYCDEFIQMVITLKLGACFIPEPLAVWRLSSTGYANTLEYDPEISLKVWSHAADLMRTRYADLFPIDWVNRWEKQKVHYSRLKGLRGLWKQQLTIMQDFFGTARWFDRVFLTVMSWSLGAVFLVLLGYLLLRRGPDTWPLLLRWARAVLQRFAMRVGHTDSRI